MVATINADTTNGVVITSDTSGEIELQANGVTKAKVTANGLQDANGASLRGGSFRNLIINGDMQIAQRGTSATGITSAGYYTVDRYKLNIGGTSSPAWTMSQDTDVPTGQGFNYSVKLQCTTAKSSLDVNNYVQFEHRLEGQMCQHLKYGTSNAEKTTISFWIKTNKTGTYIYRLYQAGNSRAIHKSFTINSADTWEKKTLTLDGDTVGTLANDNTQELQFVIWLAAGTNFTSGTLDTTWSSYTPANSAVGQVNLADSTSNYINITGVQLEIGEGASDFQFLPYDVQLARCQRYCWVWDAAQANSNYAKVALGWWNNSTTFRCIIHFPTTMRASPSSITSTGAFNCFDGTGNVSVSAVGIDQAFTQTLSLTVTTSAATQYRPGFYQAESNQTAKLVVSAEL